MSAINGSKWIVLEGQLQTLGCVECKKEVLPQSLRKMKVVERKNNYLCDNCAVKNGINWKPENKVLAELGKRVPIGLSHNQPCYLGIYVRSYKGGLRQTLVPCKNKELQEAISNLSTCDNSFIHNHWVGFAKFQEVYPLGCISCSACKTSVAKFSKGDFDVDPTRSWFCEVCYEIYEEKCWVLKKCCESDEVYKICHDQAMHRIIRCEKLMKEELSKETKKGAKEWVYIKTSLYGDDI